MSYQLPSLPYAYNALEPYIDELTMQIHHDKHHQTYVNNANAAIEKVPEFANLTAEEVIQRLDQAPVSQQTALRNNVGGHVNHSMFWQVMAPNATELADGPLLKALEKTFDSFAKFKEQFNAAATGRFGSGWAWLVVKDGNLAIISTANQDSPLAKPEFGGSNATPILNIDVWEHAYYLKYQNRRPEYITAFWKVINWAEVNKRFEQAH